MAVTPVPSGLTRGASFSPDDLAAWVEPAPKRWRIGDIVKVPNGKKGSVTNIWSDTGRVVVNVTGWGEPYPPDDLPGSWIEREGGRAACRPYGLAQGQRGLAGG